MHRRISRLALGLLTLHVGAHLDLYVREPRGHVTDSYGTSARCLPDEITDHPFNFIFQTVEPSESLRAAGRLDSLCA